MDLAALPAHLAARGSFTVRHFCVELRLVASGRGRFCPGYAQPETLEGPPQSH
jgi:hypothetical protein